MKKILISMAVFLTSFLGAYGDTYFGTITETVTETNDPLYHVGQTFTGSYRYDSPTVDGTFHVLIPSVTPVVPGENYTLTGSVFMPFATDADFSYMGVQYHMGNGFGEVQQELVSTINGGQLTVAGGLVNDFAWSFEQGGFYASYSGSTFNALSFYDRGPMDQVPFTRGTLTFGTPMRVPDATTTLPLLAASLVAVALFRRRVAC